MKNLLIIFVWFPATLFTLFLSIAYYSYYHAFLNTPKNQNSSQKLAKIPYQFYTSIPKVLGAQTVNAFHVQSQDIVPELIYNYMKKHKSPMIGSYKALIAAARQYDLDPLFLVSIAQCESNLGKKMPPNCHNPFGWGIHSKGTLCFESWEEGYLAVSEGLRKKYFDKGYENPEEIMTKYTPPALEKGGSWAKCVNQFLNELNTIKDEM
jgi:energy-coupling factor transporter transmembrane protein EcfT